MLAGQFESEDVHQFCDGRFGGHVVAAEHADPLQAESRFVEFHHDPTAPALRDVEDDQSPVDRLFEHADEPFAGRGVSCAEGFEHDAPEPFGREHRAQGPFLDAGEELDDGDTSAQAGGDVQGFVVALRLENVFGVVGDIDAHVGQGRIVVRPEGAQVFRTAFGRAVGAEQTVLEIERHFGNGGAAVDAGRSDFDGRHQVFAPVGAQHADRNLAAGEDDGFGQVFEQEAQGRSGVGHRVG